MVALLSQPGASHDELYHATNIWCGQGERAPYCVERSVNPELGPIARTNFDLAQCQVNPDSPLVCPAERLGGSTYVANYGIYPDFYYFILSFAVVPSVELSFLLTRLMSALWTAFILGLTVWLLPVRYRLTMFLVVLTTFTATGYFMFASINPSSWTIFGVGIGWLPIHAACMGNGLSRGQRAASIGLGLLACGMAIGSRNDAIFFIAVALSLVVVHVVSSRLPRLLWVLPVTASLVALAGWVILSRFSFLSPRDNVKRLYTFVDGQPDNISFFTEGLLQGLPNAMRAVGTVPIHSFMALPPIILVAALVLFGFFFVQTFNYDSRLQLCGFVLTAIAISLSVMAQVAWLDERDPGGVEPRYVYPLFVFAAGWWYLLGPESLKDRVGRYLRPAAVAATAIFALTMFTVAERFVDKQTFGLRYLPEGHDQWWWSWLPFGPNVVVILAPIFLWRFFTEMRTLIEHDDHQLIA